MINVTDSGYERNGSEYLVGYGQEFGLKCYTSPLFRSEWLFENKAPSKSSKIDGKQFTQFCWRDAVPAVQQDSTGVHNYFAVENHQPGQLYALRTENNSVILRTLESNTRTTFGRANIGIQDIARGAYLCVATNGMMNSSMRITVKPTGWFSMWC